MDAALLSILTAASLSAIDSFFFEEALSLLSFKGKTKLKYEAVQSPNENVFSRSYWGE